MASESKKRKVPKFPVKGKDKFLSNRRSSKGAGGFNSSKRQDVKNQTKKELKHIDSFNEMVESDVEGENGLPLMSDGLTIEEFSNLREAMYAVKQSRSPSAFQAKEFFSDSENFENVIKKLRKLLLNN